MTNFDTIVVGAGIFGTTIGLWLRRQGQSVLILDAEKPLSGSAPAACIVRPQWLGKMSKKEMAQAFSVLDELYGLHELEARILVAGFTKSISVYWVAPRAILKAGRFEPAEVVEVGVGESPWVRCSDGRIIHARSVVVAAGVWSSKLCTINNLTAQAGVAFTWKTEDPEDGRPRIAPWAPYRQLVALNRAPYETWAGDGTALKQSSLTPERIAASRERCAKFVNMPPEDATEIVGLRPYIRGLKDPCLVEEVMPNIFVASGGSKNGTAGAGWAAYKIAEATN